MATGPAALGVAGRSGAPEPIPERWVSGIPAAEVFPSIRRSRPPSTNRSGGMATALPTRP